MAGMLSWWPGCGQKGACMIKAQACVVRQPGGVITDAKQAAVQMAESFMEPLVTRRLDPTRGVLWTSVALTNRVITLRLGLCICEWRDQIQCP